MSICRRMEHAPEIATLAAIQAQEQHACPRLVSGLPLLVWSLSTAKSGERASEGLLGDSVFKFHCFQRPTL